MYIVIINIHRRTFRSQTSDLWTDAAAVVGRVREERVSRKTIKVREKVEQSRNTVFSPQFCGSRGSKSRLRKATVQSCLIGWEIKNCTILHVSFLQDVLQNCFVSDVVNFEFCGSLTESLRVHFHSLRRSCRVAWYWTCQLCQLPLFFEVSHNCFLSDRYCR